MKCSLIVANIRMIPIYDCSVCKKGKEGSTTTLEISCADPNDIGQEIDRLGLRVRDMPVGWASYGGIFKCESCKT